MTQVMDRRRAIAKLVRAGAAVLAVGTIPVMARSGRDARLRIAGTSIRIRVLRLDPRSIGPGDRLAG